MASKAYLEAAYDSAFDNILELLKLLPDIPFIDEQSEAKKKLYSDEGQKRIWKLIKDAVAAGEAADAKVAKVADKRSES